MESKKAKDIEEKNVKTKPEKLKKAKNIKASKNKKGITIAAIVIIVALLVVGIIYCAMIIKEQHEANKVVETMFNSIKSGENEARNKYLAYDEIVNNNETEDQNTEAVNSQFNALFSKLEYKIVKTQVDSQKASITVEVSNKNTGTVFSNYISKAMSLAISNASKEGYTEENFNDDLQQLLTNEMNSKDVETVTNTITIDMIKENGNWKIITDSNRLANVVLPGLADKLQAVQSAINNN